MIYTKETIYNLALGALLLQRRIINADTDTSNECKVLNIHYDTAFAAALENMDLDGTSSQTALQLVATDPYNDGRWMYSYAYPTDCAFLRRIQSEVIQDSEETRIPVLVRVLNGQKVILTNQETAIAEYISTDVPLSALSASAGLAVAYWLAGMAAPLVVGKGATELMKTITGQYIVAKSNAQEQDARENFNYTPPEIDSTFAAARLR